MSEGEGASAGRAAPRRRLGGARSAGLYLAFAALATLGGRAFVNHQREQLRRGALEYLTAVVDLKAHEHESEREERLGDARVASRSPELIRAVQVGASGEPTVLAAAAAQAELIRSSYDYREVFIVDRGGTVVAATSRGGAALPPETLAAMVTVVTTGQAQLVRPVLHAPGFPLIADVVTPLLGTEAVGPHIFGAAILRIDARARLLSLLAEWPGPRPGRLGLVRLAGDRLLSFDLGRASDPSYVGRDERLADARGVEARVARGNLKPGEAVDDRGEAVFVVARSLGAWIVVAQSPADAIYGPAAAVPWLVAGWIATLLTGTLAFGRAHARRVSADAIRASEGRLRESEATFRNLFENMQDAFMSVEFGGARRVLRANPAAVKMFGYQRAEELVGRSMIDELTADPKDALALREALLTSGVAREQRSTFRRADGTLIPVEGNVRLIRDEGGAPVALEGVVRDMSAHYQRQSELIAAREAAVAAAQVKSRFLANMSHEIRTPLNAIVGLGHLLLRGTLPSQPRDYVEKIQMAARMLLEIVNGVLDYSKIEAGKLELDARPFQLDEVLDHIANLVATQAQGKGVDLVFDLTDVPATLVGDPVRLGQVLTNLINNAVKFTEAGTVTVTVSAVGASEARVRLRFAVRDTGIGLDAEQIARLFSPFTQVDDSSTRRFGGTGLGLAISRQLVELMGGRIEVESVPKVGSTFSFVVELAVAPGAPATTGEPFPALVAGRQRVLVVDDNRVSRLILARYLRELSFAPEAIESGEGAVPALLQAEVAGQPFQVVLLDWRLPGPDGFEIARRINAAGLLGHAPAIILVTAHAAGDLSNRVREAGIAGLLFKPVTRSMMYDALARAVGPAVRRSRKDEASAPPIDPVLTGARVLLVEDNEINQQVARELLAGVGVDVRMAENGRAALEAIAEAAANGLRFDAVLMDLQMPEMDGFQATRAIRSDPRHAHLPIIAVTAHALELERERCAAVGMNGQIAKPIDPSQMYEVLAQAIRRGATASPTSMAIAGVDVATALSRVRGNRALFVRLLRELVRRWRDGAAQLRGQLERRDAAAARLTAHTLKGAAGNLGVDGVAAAADAVEKAIAAGDLSPSVALIALEERLRADCDAITRALPDGTR